MSEAWTIKNQDGRLSPGFVGYSRQEVEEKVVGTHYNAQALRTDARYRALFERDLAEQLKESGWTIVPIRLVETAAST